MWLLDWRKQLFFKRRPPVFFDWSRWGFLKSLKFTSTWAKLFIGNSMNKNRSD
ncbi:hypothetical protein D932_00246 [Enterococcus casseliflavus 14-MB-W-14]|nr:hypothetical protein D932_00246 [Enterococcus casseliflavus 14-MB-W-14]